MDANGRELILKDEVYSIISCALEIISPLERGQMLNYLRITGLPVGVIINFKKPKLEWERIVLSS